MPWKQKLTAILLIITLVGWQALAPAMGAQTAPPLPTPDELDQLLSPVALYPDSLLAQITTASTNPQEILDANSWLQQNSGLTGTALTDAAQAQMFDPAFIALVNFPQVLQMMADHVDDYASIGDAFSADQGSVAASIQRLRNQAYAAGTLRSTSQQEVQVQQQAGQPIYVIQPANPQVVYVPVYDPTVVYVRPAGAVVTTSFISFGIGIGIGALLVDNSPWGWGGWGWNWGSRRAYYNHSVWIGWGSPYRPPHISYHPRPVVWSNRPGYGGNWGYRPPNYRPPTPRPLSNRPTRPTSGGFNRPPSNTPPSNTPNRPPSNRPLSNAPSRPPSTEPPSGGSNRPPSNRPPSNGSDRPTRPSEPGTGRPPSTQPSATGPNRPPSSRPPSSNPNRPPSNNQNQAPSNRPPSSRPSRPNSSQPESARPSGGRSDSSPTASRPPSNRSETKQKPTEDSDHKTEHQ